MTRAADRAPSRAPSPRATLDGRTADEDYHALRSRYAESEAKRKRAEAMADGLAQRVVRLEQELREAQGRSLSASHDEPRRLGSKLAELEQAFAMQSSVLASTRAKLEEMQGLLGASEAANARLDEQAARARQRADAAEEALARLEESIGRGEWVESTEVATLRERLRQVERELEAERAARVSEAEAARAERSEVEDAIAQERAKVGILEERVGSLELDLERARNAAALAETALAEATNWMNAAEARAEAAERRATVAEAKVAEAEERIGRLDADLSQARSDAGRLAERLAFEETAAREGAVRLATAEAKLAAAEAKLATLQAIAEDLDRALRRERARLAEFENGRRRAQIAAIASARDVLARLARHERKLAVLRAGALERARELLEEARGVPGGVERSHTAQETHAVAPSRHATEFSGLTAELPRTESASSPETVAQAPKIPDLDSLRHAASPSTAGAGDACAANAGAHGETDAPGKVARRTHQGIAALARGGLGNATKNPSTTSQAEPDANDPDVVEVTIEDD